MNGICAGLPTEWWDSRDDGARLGMAICRRCPSRAECRDADPAPHGVIRGGSPFPERGALLQVCPTCGYPQPGEQTGTHDRCPRCEIPTLAQFKPDILRWTAAGMSDRKAGLLVGATSRQIKDVRRDRRGRSGDRAHCLQGVSR